jgi:hypothetical protein
MSVAASVLAVGALLAPGCDPGCAPDQNRGVVWVAADPSRINQPGPAPAFGGADQTQVRINLLLWIRPGAAGKLSADCELEIQAYAAQSGEARQPYCLYVELAVAADDAAAATVVDGPMSRAFGGDTVGCCVLELAPGQVDVGGTHYPGIGPGATLRWDVSTGSDVVTYEYVVPPEGSFQPISWDL